MSVLVFALWGSINTWYNKNKINEEIWKTLNNFKKHETSKLSNGSGSQVKLSGLIFDESDPLYSET